MRGEGARERTQRSGWEEGGGGGREWFPSAVESRPLQRTPRPELALHCANGASVPCHARHAHSAAAAAPVLPALCAAHTALAALAFPGIARQRPPR